MQHMSHPGSSKPKNHICINSEIGYCRMDSVEISAGGKKIKKQKQFKHKVNAETVNSDSNKPVPSRFQDNHFQKAFSIINGIWNSNSKIEDQCTFNFDNTDEQILTYELAAGVLKYSFAIEEILHTSELFVQYPQHTDDNIADIAMLTFDLLERNFQIEEVDKYLSPKFQDIQTSLLTIREKLKDCTEVLFHGAQNIITFLPENISRQTISQMPNFIYAWVNTLKMDTEKAIQSLEEFGLRQITENEMYTQPNGFYVDVLHTDLVRLHQEKEYLILNSFMTQDGAFIVQDKISCIVAYSLVKALYFKELMNRGRRRLDGSYELSPLSEFMIRTPYGNPIPILMQDWYHGIIEDPETYAAVGNSIIVTHTGSTTRSIAHLAVLLQTSVPKWLIKQTEMPSQGDLLKSIESKFVRRPALNVIAFGAPCKKLNEITDFLKDQVGLKNVKVYSDDFMNIEPSDRRVRGSIAILVNPPSTGTALRDPVYHICKEGGDEKILEQLSQYTYTYYNSLKSSDPDQTKILRSNLGKYLRHALRFEQARLIMYTTLSELKSENSDIVTSIVADLQKENEEKKVKFFSNLLTKKSPKSFTEIQYELVDMFQILNTYPRDFFNGLFLEMPRTIDLNGGFIALIRRKEKVIQISRNPSRGNETQSAMTIENADSNNVESILKNANGKFTQLELSNFLIEKDSDVVQSEVGLNSIPRALEISQKYNFSITSAYKFNDPSKKKISANTAKKIIERLQVPTFSTLAKQTGKWRPSTPTPSTPTSRPTSSTSMDKTKFKVNSSRPASSNIADEHKSDDEHVPFIHPRQKKHTFADQHSNFKKL